jgi:ABC-type antimicrobial peptide transport system permease subunit
MEDWGNNSYWTYVLLAPNTNIKSFNEKIRGLISKHNTNSNNTQIYVQHIGEIHLHSAARFTAEIGSQGDIRYVRSLQMIAIFILFIACINFMNLSTAQSIKRAKEVGMKKISGAGRGKLVMQFLSESVFLVLLADIVAMVMVESLLPWFNNLTGKSLAIEYFSLEHLQSTLGIILLTGIVAGSYPAFFLSSFSPLKVLKGKFKTGKSAAIFRKILVTGQFTISIILIIGTLIVTRQLRYIQEKKLGYDKDNIAYFFLTDGMKKHMEALKQDILEEPGIESVTYTNQLPSNIGSSSWGWNWDGKSSTEEVLMHMVMVDEDFQKTFKIAMAEGRYYSAEMRNDSSNVVINESAARIISDKESVIGKVLSFGNYKLTIIGVVKDFNFKSVHRKIEPLVMGCLPKECYITVMRINSGNMKKATSHIEKTFKKYASDQPYYLGFLDQDLENLYLSEKRMGVIFRYFSLLAILISCLGLFGLSLFTAEQKTKEIGIRKTMGATSLSIVTLFLKQYFRWVLLATIIATPIAWYTMQAWLDNFAYRISIHPMEFIVASLMAFAIAMITVGYHAIRASGQNPVISLRYE